ncbi:MAG: helix-hairpin-helix domain-containing protein [Gemmatimonadaceae bacterium]
MPTASEQKALAFVAIVILLGGVVRVRRARALEAIGPSVAEQQALARQSASANSLATEQLTAKQGKRRAGARRPARRADVVKVVGGVESVPFTDVRPGSSTGELPGWRNGFPPPVPRIDRGIWDQSTPYRAPSPATRPEHVAGTIDLDAATAREIESLPAIGPALAGRIVANRDSFGPFGSLDALGRVKGMGPATRRRLTQRVTFSGQARR